MLGCQTKVTSDKLLPAYSEKVKIWQKDPEVLSVLREAFFVAKTYFYCEMSTLAQVKNHNPYKSVLTDLDKTFVAVDEEMKKQFTVSSVPVYDYQTAKSMGTLFGSGIGNPTLSDAAVDLLFSESAFLPLHEDTDTMKALKITKESVNKSGNVYPGALLGCDELFSYVRLSDFLHFLGATYGNCTQLNALKPFYLEKQLLEENSFLAQDKSRNGKFLNTLEDLHYELIKYYKAKK